MLTACVHFGHHSHQMICIVMPHAPFTQASIAIVTSINEVPTFTSLMLHVFVSQRNQCKF